MTVRFQSRPAFYRVWCRYEPDHMNMATGRRGQWRVVKVAANTMDAAIWIMRASKLLSVPSAKPYPRGCIIRPHKELNRVLAARRVAS